MTAYYQRQQSTFCFRFRNSARNSRDWFKYLACNTYKYVQFCTLVTRCRQSCRDVWLTSCKEWFASSSVLRPAQWIWTKIWLQDSSETLCWFLVLHCLSSAFVEARHDCLRVVWDSECPLHTTRSTVWKWLCRSRPSVSCSLLCFPRGLVSNR